MPANRRRVAPTGTGNRHTEPSRLFMDGRKENPASLPPAIPGGSRWHDLQWLGVLLVLAAGLHLWLIAHTEVTARDGVGFMRYAWQLQSQPWVQVLRQNPHPPFYPLCVLAMSYPVRHLTANDELVVMQLSAQLTSALAGTLLVVPMFFLGRALFNARAGFWAALLFQCWPASSRVLGDALSEGVFLLLLATGLLFALQAFRMQSLVRFALCGLCGGLAYLTRPEGVLLVAATGLILVGLQLAPAGRRPWGRVVSSAAALVLAALAVSSPYMAVIQNFTNKTTGLEILESAGLKQPEAPACPSLTALPLAVYNYDSKDFGFWQHHVWCLKAVGWEVIKGYHYVCWLPALLGLVWYRRRLWEVPGAWVLVVLMVLDLAVLWRVAYVAGYVADRHSLLTVMASSFWAVAMITTLVEGLVTVLRRRGRLSSTESRWTKAPAWSVVVLLGLALSGLPKTLEPLHPNRAGFHAAGRWLAVHVQPGEQILDPFCWVEYYAGQVHEQVLHPKPFARPRYVVLGGSKNEHERLPAVPAARFFAAQGTLVYHWPTKPVQAKAEEVSVYQVP
jgi:hypothetical protein